MNRYEILKRILEERKYFKVVCGAGNEDPIEVERITMVYTLAGTTTVDISANVEIVKAAKKGIEKAKKIAPDLYKEITIDPYINVSVGLKGDPHIRKARINKELCVECGLCIEPCEQHAITEQFDIIEQKCIGCGDCAEVCPEDAIEFYNKKVDLNKTLPECIKHGTETLELHAVSNDDESVMKDWKLIDSLVPNNFVSMCLDRSLLSNNHLIRRIKEAYEITGERFIVQADGVPMSGGSGDYNTTLQAVAIADIIRKSGIPIKLLLSGGTNSKSGELARMCGVDFNGVAIGTFARKIIYNYITTENFKSDIALIEKAVEIAEKLIKDNIGGESFGQYYSKRQ
jgi:ferredoxin